jgi:type I restriction enzyme S subunit
VSDVPPGWALTTLGEIGIYLNGRGFKKSEWRDSGRPIIRIQNLTGSGASFNYFQGEADDRHVARDGELLVSWAATLGVYVWRGPEAVINQHIFKVESHIDPRFHRYVLEAALDDLQRQTHGSGMVHITKGRFDATPVAMPPLNEQRRIVAAIEEHLSRLDAADASLASALVRAGLFRGAILETAFSNGAPRRTVGDVASLADGPFGSNLKTAHYVATGPRVVRLQNIGDGVFRDERAHITQDHFDGLTKHAVVPGDLVVASLGDEAPRACLIPDWLGDAIVKADCIRVRPGDSVDAAYLMWSLNSRPVKTQAAARIKGIGRPRLGLGGIRALEVPVPPLEEQRRIVQEVEERLSRIDAMRASIERAQRRSKALRAAILERAFRGELVPQDSSDEPAESLLARIRADRTATERRRGRPSGI